MNILISGKHTEIGKSLSSHIEKRLEEVLHKYLGRVVQMNVVITKEGHRFQTDINGNTGTSTGVIIKSTATSEDVYASFDAAAEKIEKQLRRYKSRLTDHHKAGNNGESVSIKGKKYVIKDHEEAHDSPVIIAEKPTAIETLTVSAAVMKMDLAELPALMFFNSATGRINIVYKRTDGNISWVDPEGKVA